MANDKNIRLTESELNYTRSVAKVDEYERAEVSLLLHPTHNADALTDVLCRQLAAHVGTLIILCQ